jgi:hypothetical protein
LLGLFAEDFGHFLQCLFFRLYLPQHFDFTFFEEQLLLQPEQFDRCANSTIEALAAMILDFSHPQNGQTIQAAWSRLPHSWHSSWVCILYLYLGHPKNTLTFSKNQC